MRAVVSFLLLGLGLILFMAHGPARADGPGSFPALPESLVLIQIPAGSFFMGGPTITGDAPEVEVFVSGFWISERETTNAQYVSFLNSALVEGWIAVEDLETVDPCGRYMEKAVVGTGPAPHTGQVYLQLGETGGCTSGGEPEHLDNRSWISFDPADNRFLLLDEDRGDWPVNWVKWHGADAFARFYGASLPTEAQWEYAARAGRQLEYPTDDGTLSPDKANYNGDLPGVHNPEGHVLVVGSYSANPFGLYDLGGNVWEWCLDYYDPGFYTQGAVDPVNTTAGVDPKRVRRGGSWNYHAATLLTYARAFDQETRGNNHFGFRIVMGE